MCVLSVGTFVPICVWVPLCACAHACILNAHSERWRYCSFNLIWKRATAKIIFPLSFVYLLCVKITLLTLASARGFQRVLYRDLPLLLKATWAFLMEIFVRSLQWLVDCKLSKTSIINDSSTTIITTHTTILGQGLHSINITTAATMNNATSSPVPAAIAEPQPPRTPGLLSPTEVAAIAAALIYHYNHNPYLYTNAFIITSYRHRLCCRLCRRRPPSP